MTGTHGETGRGGTHRAAGAVKRQRIPLWPLVVAGLLLGNMAICGVTIVAATRSAAPVEASYYQRAVDWDNGQAACIDARRLGWRLRLSPEADEVGRYRLAALDAQGAEVRVDAAAAEFFHGSRPDAVRSAPFVRGAGGAWCVDAGTLDAGRWEFRVRVLASSRWAAATCDVFVEAEAAEAQGR